MRSNAIPLLAKLRTDMPRHIKIGLIILGVGFAVTFGFFIDVIGRIQSMVNDRETEENPFVRPAAPLYEPSDPPMSVKLFFPSSADDVLLKAEDSVVFKSAGMANRARQILQKVFDGPQSQDLQASIPPDTKLQELFVSDEGVVFVDFTNTLATNHPGGILNEQATIYSIVNSLTYNLSEIKQVKILIGGVEKETLAGHCLLLLPFEMDLSITNIPAAEHETLALGGGTAGQP